MDFTPNLNLPIPNADAVPPKNISDQFPDIALALTMLDAIIHTLQGVVAGKAEANHSQAMSTITGLVDALAAKMPANTTFSLDDLEDVMGAADALVNYVLVKNASGFWVPSTALAALGVHNHAISEVVGLAGLLDDMQNAMEALSLGKANKGVTITGGGLASGGGDLSGNRVITVTKASDVEAQARTRDDVAVSPRGVGLAVAAYTKWRTVQDSEFSNVASLVVNNLAGFRNLRFRGALRSHSSAGAILFQVSTDNGVTWITTYNYQYTYLYSNPANNVGASWLTAQSSIPLYGGNQFSATLLSHLVGEISFFDTASVNPIVSISSFGQITSTQGEARMMGYPTGSVRANAFRLLGSTNFTGNIIVEAA